MAGFASTWAAALNIFVSRHGYLTLFVAMFLEGFGLPLPAELLFIPAGFLIHSRDLSFGGVLLSSTLGGLAGNVTGYLVARLGGEELFSRYGRFVKLGDDHLNQFRAWISRHGGKTIFVSRFVGPIRAASIVGAGVGRMPVWEYILYQAAAGLVWNFTWAFAAGMFGRRVARLIHHFGLTSVAVGGAVIVLILVIWRLQAVKRRREMGIVRPEGGARWQSLMNSRRTVTAALGALLLLALAVSLYRYFFPSPARVRLPAEMPLGPGDSILVVAPHSDDETLGPGGLIHRAVLEGIPVHVLMMTNGDGFTLAAEEERLHLRPSPQDYMHLAQRRQQETLDALAVLGVPAENVIFLGYPDRGLAPMWTSHWSPDQPYFSRFTQTDRSPYTNSLTPGALYCGQSVADDVRRVLLDLKPTVLVYPHPNDAHPDHYATNAFVNYALQELRDEGHSFATQVRQYLYLVHRGDWPAPKGLHLATALVPPGPLVHTDTAWFEFPLDPDTSWAKYQAILRYRSQVRIMERYLESFARKNDLLGTVPTKAIPLVPAGLLRVGGDAAAWAAVPPLITDPTADTLTRQLEGSADLKTLRVATDGANLFLRLETRRPVSSRVRYVIRFRTLAPALPGKGARARRGEMELSLRPTFTPVLTGGAGNAAHLRFAVADGGLEVSLPLSDLDHPREIFVGAESFLLMGVDRLAWTLAPLPTAAWPAQGPAPKGEPK